MAISKYIRRINIQRILANRTWDEEFHRPGQTWKEHYEDCMKELPHSESS